MPRYALAADVHDIAALYHLVWHETQAPFMPEEERARRTLTFFVHRMKELIPTSLVEHRGGSVAAFSSWNGNLLGQLFVARDYRGTRLASELLSATEREMAKWGIGEAELHCVVGNDRARRFYERMGWRHFGEIFEVVAGPGREVSVPFWRMIKVLRD
jgi:GNAT superfamily N-acetyltransferase